VPFALPRRVELRALSCRGRAFILVMLNHTFFLLRLTLSGKRGYFFTKESIHSELIWGELMYGINGPLFLPIIMFLYKGLECHYPVSPAVACTSSTSPTKSCKIYQTPNPTTPPRAVAAPDSRPTA
jgi:hypothetical protein